MGVGADSYHDSPRDSSAGAGRFVEFDLHQADIQRQCLPRAQRPSGALPLYGNRLDDILELLQDLLVYLRK